MFGPNDVDKDGKVSVWSIPDQKWVSRWPVDAIEMVKSGVATRTRTEDSAFAAEDVPQ